MGTRPKVNARGAVAKTLVDKLCEAVREWTIALPDSVTDVLTVEHIEMLDDTLKRAVEEHEREVPSATVQSIERGIEVAHAVETILETTISWDATAKIALLVAGEEPTEARVAELAAQIEQSWAGAETIEAQCGEEIEPFAPCTKPPGHDGEHEYNPKTRAAHIDDEHADDRHAEDVATRGQIR